MFKFLKEKLGKAVENISKKIEEEGKEEVKTKEELVEALPEKKKGFFSKLFGGKEEKKAEPIVAPKVEEKKVVEKEEIETPKVEEKPIIEEQLEEKIEEIKEKIVERKREATKVNEIKTNNVSL